MKTLSESLYDYFDDENPFNYLTTDELNEAYGVFVARRSGRAFRETNKPKSNATLSTEAKHSKRRKGSGTNAVNADDPIDPLLSSKPTKSKTAAPVAVPPVAVAPLAVAVVKAVAVNIET